MSQETKFTRAEVKFLYRAFKQECPNGIIDEETFKEVYENIFPLGDASKYASLVFKCIDKEETGKTVLKFTNLREDPEIEGLYLVEPLTPYNYFLSDT